ncbi:Hypothetical_protein [Hexamita inflata]|uniref:Hypothetical_protein n=1 Tax=Hexamita inflata TaxID=28002 RepID=A0AA86R1S7_9EUKA|nr:Hypothetical protein HINF_LOCUS53036 [Hexamita inflata]
MLRITKYLKTKFYHQQQATTQQYIKNHQHISKNSLKTHKIFQTKSVNQYQQHTQIEHYLTIKKHQFQIEDQIQDQYMPTIKEQKIQKMIQIIDVPTILLQNTSQQRKQINARVNPMKEQISQCLLNLNNNHLQFSRNVVSIFKQLEAGESCQ